MTSEGPNVAKSITKLLKQQLLSKQMLLFGVQLDPFIDDTYRLVLICLLSYLKLKEGKVITDSNIN